MRCVVFTMGKHHTEIRPYRIYALVLGKDFFIGKTASPRISAVYSRHRCGNVAATQETMDQEHPPALYILEELNCTGAEAYKHILAWICRFEAAGYCTINHTGTAIASETLHPPTEALFQKLMQEPMDQILARTHVPKPSDANRKPSVVQRILMKQEKKVQMNLRMTAKDKRTFDRFCRKYHLNAREGLGLLLDQITGEEDHLQPLLEERAAYQLECNQLKARLAVLEGEHFPGREQRALEYLSFLKTGLSDCLQQIAPMPEGECLPAYSYKQFKSPSGIHPQYPESEGFLVMQAIVMLWGKNKSRFIVGRGQSGECLKVRYYPKPFYMGLRIWEYPPGTWWLLGCRRAADGAMEVAAAFPLPSEWKQRKEAVPLAETDPRPSLDDQIRIAATRP